MAPTLTPTQAQSFLHVTATVRGIDVEQLCASDMPAIEADLHDMLSHLDDGEVDDVLLRVHEVLIGVGEPA